MFQEKKERNKIFRINGFVFLISFLFFFLSNNFFQHIHYVDNNLLIHSHPFKSDPHGKPVHEHSSTDYSLIEFMNNILFYFAFIAVVINGNIILNHKIISHYLDLYFSFFLFPPKAIRGPPVINLY